jgi:hypothetical protein
MVKDLIQDLSSNLGQQQEPILIYKKKLLMILRGELYTDQNSV